MDEMVKALIGGLSMPDTSWVDYKLVGELQVGELTVLTFLGVVAALVYILWEDRWG